MDDAFDGIAAAAGPGSAARRREALAALFERATESEVEFITRLLSGGLRQGAARGVMLEAVAPRVMNTKMNPKQNAAAWMVAARRAAPVPWLSSSSVWPLTNAMVLGTNGNTHGERNETIPASSAVPSDTVMSTRAGP